MTRAAPSVAVGIFGKTPAAGFSKTRLSPPLSREECGLLSSCFIRDMTATIDEVVSETGDMGYAIYTPKGSEAAMRQLLPASFRLLLQCDGGFGDRLHRATEDLFVLGHCGAILVNSDSPTLPASILRGAIDAIKGGAPIVLSPALDGGYALIGLSKPDRRIFEDIPWSTDKVHRRTIERAAEAGLRVAELPSWYDVDDAGSLRLLEAEMAGVRPAFADASLQAAPAPATRKLLAQLRSDIRSEA